ncbi:hypothetical protein ABPG77_009748 [Micractinium sp. CCAP 211/92]
MNASASLRCDRCKAAERALAMAAATLGAFEPADYAVVAASGLTASLAVLAGAYTVPWRCCGRGAGSGSPGKQALTRDFNVLWHGRAALSLLSATWALSLLLRISSLWGANSFLLPPGAAAWAGSGWMCRIYLTASLGFLQPFCACTTLLMLTAALSRRHRPEAVRHPNARLLGRALLCTLPVAAAQAVIAWLGLAVQWQGEPVEAHPRSLLGVFFASYWIGDAQQCSSSRTQGDPQLAQCTACTFPAAAAIVHALHAVALLAALCVTSRRLAAAVLNQRLKRRMRAFQTAYSLLTALGVAAVGTSVAWGPFTWANQACWLVLVGSSLLSVLLVEWEVVVWPVRDLRAVDKRLVLWADAFAAASGDEAFTTRSSGASSLGGYNGSGGTGSLIKAHGRSADAEALVRAAASARTLSAAGGVAAGEPPTRPPMRGATAARMPLAAATGRGTAALQQGAAAQLPLAAAAWSPRQLQPIPLPSFGQQQPGQQSTPQRGLPEASVYTPASPGRPPTTRELLFP